MKKSIFIITLILGIVALVIGYLVLSQGADDSQQQIPNSADITFY